MLNAGRMQLCARYERPPRCVPLDTEVFIDLFRILQVIHHLVLDEKPFWFDVFVFCFFFFRLVIRAVMVSARSLRSAARVDLDTVVVLRWLRK